MNDASSQDAQFSDCDHHWMALALEQARQAADDGEVPVGAVIVRDNELIAVGRNRMIGLHDASAHAEMVALRAAGQVLGNYRLLDCDLYVTLEPCVMCTGALVHARLRRVIYATRDPKTGAHASAFELLEHPTHNHRIEVAEGLMAEQASEMLSAFFRQRRLEAKQNRS